MKNLFQQICRWPQLDKTSNVSLKSLRSHTSRMKVLPTVRHSTRIRLKEREKDHE